MDYLLKSNGPAHIFTDHRYLLFVFAPRALGPALGRHIVSKVQRWAIYLSRFSYVIEHIRGEDNVCPDMLTRWTRGHRANKTPVMLSSLVLSNAEKMVPRPDELVWPDMEDFRQAQSNSRSRPDGLKRIMATCY